MDRICTSLSKAGHEVTLVGRLLLNSKELRERPYKTLRIACNNHHGKAFYLEYNWRLWRTLRNWEFDAIYSVDLDTLVAGWLLKTNERLLVYDAHEWFSETPEVIHRPATRFVWRTVGKWLVPQTDMRYTVAPMLADKLAAEYGVPFGTVRNLPMRSKLAPAVADEAAKKVILYQGMFNPGRGLEVIIEAMQWLPECELLLVGDGPELGALRRCSEAFGVQSQVTFAGFRPPAELPGITRNAWLGLNLLDAISPSYYYSLANKALDYIQAGVPSVQMDFPEYRALEEEFGCYLLLDRLNAKQLADTIRKSLDNPAAYEQLLANCWAAGRELVWEKEEKVLLAQWAALGEI